MTVTRPEGISTAGKRAIWFVETLPDTWRDGVTVTDLASVIPLQCASYNFGETSDRQTYDDTRLCDENTVEEEGRTTVSLNDVEYLYDPQDPTGGTDYTHYAAMKKGQPGFILVRDAIAHAQDPAAEEIVDIYKITCGRQNRVEIAQGDAGSKYRVSQSFTVKDSEQDVAITAGV